MLLERVQRNLARYRAAVLNAAVTGKLVPTEAEVARREGREYEPATELLKRILAERRRKWEAGELARMTAAGKPPKDGRWKAQYREPAAPRTSDLPELPEGWCWATVEQLASDEPRSIQSGPFGSNLRHSEFQDEGKLVIGIDNVQDGIFTMGARHRISERKFQELRKYAARPHDLLITVMATIGRCALVPPDLEPAIVTKHVYRVSPEQRLVLPRYLLLAFWGGASIRDQLARRVQGQTRPGLNGEIIKSISVPVPPQAEQRRIAGEADRLLSIGDEVAPALTQNLRRCGRLRQAVLKWAFEGRLVDQDAADEPASVLLERINAERAAAQAAAQTTKQKTGRSRRRTVA
jgi:type I restriction enzyme S subunit